MTASVSLPSSTRSSAARLPEGWSPPEPVEDVIDVAGLAVRRAGVASVAPDGEEITGSAAALEATSPISDARGEVPPAMRAWFELLERASVVGAMRATDAELVVRTRAGMRVGACSRRELFPESDDPSRWRPARSNGVALHRDWAHACDRALWELAERDRVLASWEGLVRPVRIAGAPLGLGPTSTRYDWSAFAFPEEAPGSFSSGLEVVGVFGFPREPELPLALGFAARPALASALDDATREAVQLLAFLWGEPVAPAPVHVAPTAMGHLDFYQPRERHALLRSWLAGEHAALVPAERGAHVAAVEGSAITFADLTPPWLDGLRVAKAVCASARALAFGDAPSLRHLPHERRIHPIA